MQRKIILFFLVCLSSSVLMADLKEKIEEINVMVKNTGSTQEDCSTCSVASAGLGVDNGSMMRSCVESICKNKSFSLADTLNKIYEGTTKANPTYDGEITPLINAITKEDANDQITRGNTYAEWIKNPPDLKKPGAIRVFNMFVTLNSFSKFKFSVADGKPVIDVAKSRSAFSDLSDDEFNKKVQIGGKILSSLLDKEITETDPARVQLIYGNNFKSKVDEVIASFADKQKQIENDPELGFIVKLQAFKQMASGEKLKPQFSTDQINPDAIENLNQANSVLNLFVAISKDPDLKKMLDSQPIDIKKAIVSLGTEKLLKDRTALQQAVLSGSTPALSAKCRTAFEMAQQVLPSQKDLDLFKAKVNGLKSNFSDKTKSLICDSSSKNYQDQIFSWSANFPLTREQYLINMKASLTRGLAEAKKWKSQYDEIDSSPDKDTIYAIWVSSLKPEYNNVTSFSDDICDNLMTNIVPDATNFFSNSFVTGPMVVKHSDSDGICYHEMGHKLFYYMKYQNTCTDKAWFGKARACLLSNHTELSPEEIAEQAKMALIGGDSKYESEDWADLISAQVDDKANNFACLFAQKLKDEDYKALSLRNADSSDPHSSDLFRLLHLNFLKNGKIPTQCEQALSTRGEKANFKNCLEK
jgi:hypothetical protein